MKIVIASFAVAMATLSTQAQAHSYRSNDWVDMTLQDSYQHPASWNHQVCVYDSLIAGGYSIQVVMSGICEYSIKFNVVTGQWRRH